jgi:hypothetical protein
MTQEHHCPLSLAVAFIIRLFLYKSAKKWAPCTLFQAQGTPQSIMF